ncbi:MAG: hypothetical protein WKF29_10695 [Thermoleophilaceae bacterium]
MEGGAVAAGAAPEHRSGEQGTKGLKENAIGFVDALIIGIASTAPAYSLAAVHRRSRGGGGPKARNSRRAAEGGLMASVVLGYDDSPGSKAALTKAIDLAKTYGLRQVQQLVRVHYLVVNRHSTRWRRGP